MTSLPPRQIPQSAEFVPSLPGSVAHSFRTPLGSLGSLPATPKATAPMANGLSYSFINAEFIDNEPDQPQPASVAAFRNTTSTPRSSHPASLPKSLPLDWGLFNRQFELQQRRKLARLQSRLENHLENNFENLPYPVIDFIADCVESQNDLIALSQTCKFFNKMINKRLYAKLIFVDNISDHCMHYDGDYTLVDAANYPKLLASLHSNEDLIQLIKEIVIDTSSNNSSYDSLHENIYAALYDLFLTTNNNLRVLENLDFNNLKKFNSVFHYNKDHLIKHNYNKYTYFYPASDNMADLIRKDLLHLKNFQLLDLNDINSLPLSTTSISLIMEHEFQLHDPFKLQYSGFKLLQNLTTLKLHTAIAFDTFVNALYTLFSDTSSPSPLGRLSRLSNITTLSIGNVHRIEDVDQHSRISFKKLNTIIDLSHVQNLEIKTRCLEREQCNSCVLQFLMEWHSTLLVYEKSNLKKLSIISLPPNINKNIDFQWDSVFSSTEFLQKFGEHLEFFFINLNDFPFVPIFEKTQALDLHNHQKLPINREILRVRKEMYTNILQSFKKLEQLIIPDYFYNWAVYNNISNLSNDENLNYLNYLDTCHCSTCCDARALFKKYATQHQFKDFKGRFQTDLQYGHTTSSVNRYNMLNDNPDGYRILYNYILRELKSRIPLKQLNKVQTSLEYDKFVPNVRSSCSIIPQDDFAQLTKLFAHSLRKEIQRLIDSLPGLKKFNLGGMLFKCYAVGKGGVRVHGVYDEFDEVFEKRVPPTLFASWPKFSTGG